MWVRNAAGQTGVESDEEKIEEQALDSLLGQRMKSASLEYPSLALQCRFKGGAELAIVPTAADARARVAYWDVRLPDERVLSVGPGAQWMLTRGYGDVLERFPRGLSQEHLKALKTLSGR